MVNLESRVDLAAEWLLANITHEESYSGWGWVADVPPNPQNTAEAVCALKAINREVPQADNVARLIRRQTISRESNRIWDFDSVLDTAWRIRGLMALGDSVDDAHIRDYVINLVTRQDENTGGWRLSGDVGPLSVTATATAVRALVVAGEKDDRARRAASRGSQFLLDLVFNQDPRMESLYASSFVASLLALPEIANFKGMRIERAKELCVDRILETLEQKKSWVEEEVFDRGGLRDNWRHLGLPLSIAALGLAAKPAVIFTPVFRAAFVELLQLQETDEGVANRGAFRTSEEGFVTSFATTQALEAMSQVRRDLDERLSPALVYDLICSTQGAHHSDPQEIVAIGDRRVVMNSGAGNLGLAVAGLSGLTILVLAVTLTNQLGTTASRALVIWGTALVALGTYVFLACRLIRIRKRSIATATFAAYTALVLPVLTYLLV